MGQEQNKNTDGKHEDATGSNFKRNDVKDRVGAKFEEPHAVNPAYGKGGSGSKGNPGKPT